MTRIIAGGGKGRRLKAPKGLETRPTGARVRQTLFDILAPRLPGCRFLDAFAGSGAIGLEALSRGAQLAVLVDSGASAIASIRENSRVLAPLGGEVLTFRQDARVALPALAAQGRRFDIVYLDPPYDSDLYERALEAIDKSDLLAEGGVVVAEHFHKRVLPETIGRLLRRRSVRVGDHVLGFYEMERQESSSP
jgi:16S rRNA (guanine(966)-N(2))-methyltransferase RsmD